MFSGMSAFPDSPPDPSPFPSAPAPKCFLLALAIFNPVFLLRENASAAYGQVGRRHCVCCGRSPASCRLGSPETRSVGLQDVLPDERSAPAHPAERPACRASSPICGAAVHASWDPAFLPPQLLPFSGGLWCAPRN